MTSPRLQDFRSDRASYTSGQAAIITASFDVPVFVDTFGGFRVPVLVLSNGARAYYVGGSGTDELRFQYNVVDTDRSSLDLKVVAFAENDATLRRSSGEDADVTVRFNDVGSSVANNDILTPTFVGDVSVQTRALSTGADLVNPKIASMSSVAGTYGVGTTLDIVVSFDEVVLVRTAGGVPTLKFAGSGDVLEGFAASYVGGSGTKKLTFRVEIADGMPTASGLDVIDLSLNGGVITDLSGNSANLSIVAGTNNLAPYADIQVNGSSGDGGGVTQPGGDGSSDVTAAVIESIQSIKGDGPFDVGDRVDLRVTLSEAVTLNTLLGSPILALSNGGTAQYVSGSGTRDLLFRYTVKASDRNTQDLNVIGVAENDALIVDAAGNRTDVRITADNQLAKFGNVVIDAQAPYLRSVDAADDTYIVGDSITFTGTFSEAVTVTGTPGLNLSNGGVARYVSGSGSSLLVFKYDVTGSSQSSADLDVLSLNVADGAFASAVTGNAATVQVAPGILSFDADVLIDTSRPSGTISIDKTSLIANEVASVTVTFDEQVEDPRSAITVLNGTLSDLVGGAGDETGARSRVWTGTFTPALGIEDPTNALVLDNSKVFDDAGNPGIGLAASTNFLIDTRGPVPVVSSVAQADGSRLLTVDFGETVTDLSASGLVVENGVAGTFSKLSDSKYTLSVTPEASNPSGSIRLSLADNVIQDALGNYNDPFSASFVWDETSPVIERITSAAASYTTGQDIYIDVQFNEPVTVSPIHTDAGSNPILALSNGQVAHYASGSGTTSLTFRYTVQRGDEASDLDSLALVENASRIHDVSGNDAQVRITPGLNNLAFATNIVIDGVVPSITNVSADDGLYQAGDEVRLAVQFSEDVVLDREGGDPILALSNGSYASFVSHDGDRMVFSYAVATGDNDAQDLDVLGFAENGSAIADASGNRANVAIRFGMNNLAERNEVNIDAARPQIAETSANAGEYKAGQQIEIALAMSKGVVVDTTQGDPSLALNNGREAIFDAEKSTATTLWFVYDVLATDVREDTDTGTLYEEYDLSIKEFKYNNAEIRSLIGGADAQMTLPLSGLASEAVRIDLTLPEVVSISLSDTSLSAGEDADVTVVLSEPVRQLDVSYFSVPHGSLSAFTTTDNITWHAVYTPVRDVEADELVISLDASRLSDEAGNLGLGEAQSGSYSLDSTYPELEIRSDALGVVHKGQDVRFTLQFSEAVTGFTDADVKVVNGTKVPFSFDGPNAEGEYSIIVRPLDGSRQPIKVYVEAGAAADGAGNLSRASSVFVQPVDTDPPRIEKIAGVKGAYALGDTISIDVTFTEAVTLQLEPELSEHVLPHLSLNNGQEATYVAGSGGKTWTFEYVVSTPEDVTQLVDRETLKVLALVENDTSLLDAAGNKLEDYFVETDAQLNAGLSVDTTGAVITGFSSVDGTYKTDDVLYIRAHLSELVHVQGTPVPYLTLSNGGRATYLSGTGSSQLMFRYIVDEADGNASDLSVVSFNAPAEGIADRAGNVTDLSIVSGDNDLAAVHQIVVDTQAPELTGVRLVEDAGTASDVVNDGYYKAGTVLAFEVDFDDAVSVDVTNGTPILTLSNGSTAQYVGYVQSDVNGTMVDDPTKLRFQYAVQQDDINTQLLKVTGLAERGAKITDHAGNRAYVEVNDDQLNYTTAVVDTIAPTQHGSSDSFTANERGDDLVRTPQTITVTLRSNEVIGFDYSSIDYDALNAQTRSDLGLADDASQEDLDEAIAQSIYAAEQAVALSGIVVTFAGSRADEYGDAFADPDSDLTAVNYRLVANENGVVDGTAFAVDVEVPDRAMGTLTVSVMQGALEDLALNSNALVFSHDQAVDTQTVDFEITPSAGLFIGATSEVKIYDSVGEELSAGYRLDPATGQVVISVEPSTKYPNGYRGPVLVEVIDSDASPDYIDEFSGQAVSLSDGSASYSMRAVLNVTSPGDVPVTVSPVTELSVKKLFEAATPSAANPLDPAKVDQFNSGIAKIFGLSEIVHTKATVINSALVEQTTGVDVDDFDLSDGTSASEQYGQVLAMLSARDSQSGSLAATVEELAATIKAISQAGQTTLAITQLGADKLAAALDSSALDDDLDGAGINRELLDVAYIDEASAAGYGLNLDEAETTEVPVKGAQVGDTVFIQWGVIAQPDTDAGDVLGAPNRFSVVIDASHVRADGSVRVPVPLSVIEKQGDANEVAVSTAVLHAGSVDGDGNPVTTPTESDFRAPVLLTVDIIPPQTTVQAPDPSTPFVTLGDVDGIRGGDDLTVLLNNSVDEHFKYVLSTEFLNDYAAAISGGATASSALALVADQIPAGLTVSNIVQDAASGTLAFDWSLDLTQAISVAEQTAEAEAIAAGESYTPSATFAVDDERSVFQVQASTADLVGNADADDARNVVIIGSVDDLVDTPEEQSAMDQALNRLSARYGDAAVDTRAEIKTVADAIDGVIALRNSGDPSATSGDLVAAAQTLVLGSGGAAGTPGAVADGVHTLSIGDQTFSVDLSNSQSPTVADLIHEIAGSEGYADLPYKVGLDASGNGLAISWKAFGPQPAASSDVAVTSTQSATQLTSTISNPGSLASFAVQSIAVDGETVDGAFVPAAGDVTVAFGGTALTVTVSEGDSLADALAGLQGDGDYDSLPFRLGVNQAGDGLVATWKATQATPVTDHITVDRDFEVTTTTEIATTIVAAGSAGVTTQELAALDIANVDDSELAAINRALASDLAAVSAPVVSFADSALAAGESTTVSMTFSKRVGEVPDDVMALVGGELSSEGAAGDPIWSTVDGLTWTATFTASSDMPNTALRYAERVDEDGVLVVDANGNAVLDPVVVDGTTDPVSYGQAGEDLSQIALTEALVNRVTDAAAKVAAFADRQRDDQAALPNVQDFADMAVAGVRDDNVGAVKDALAAIRDRFEAEGDLYTQIQTVTDSYNTVFDTVYTPGATTQPSAADLVEDLTNLGVSNLSGNSARAEDQMTLLQGALRAVAAAKADITNEDSSVITTAEQQADMINSVAKLESFVASVEKVLARAGGETVDVGGTPTLVAVASEDLSALGFEGLLADTSSNSRLSSLQKVIADQSEGAGGTGIVNYANLKSVLETAADAFDDIVGLTAAAQDTTYPDNDARTAALTTALEAVDADTFQEMGIDGVRDVAIGTLTAAAMADAVKDALSNTANAVNSLENIQQVVDSYRQVLSVASGDVTGDQAVISTDQLSDLGVSLSEDDAQEPASLATLLSGIIANKASPEGGATTDNVDTVADIQALADAAKRVFDNANQSADDGGANASQADLNVLGFDAVNADNIDAIQRVLTRTDSRDGVTSFSDLKAKVDAVVNAHAALTTVVSTAQGSATPDLDGLDEGTFSDMGVDGVGAGNYAAMLDALSHTGNTVETAAAVQTVVDSYNLLLDLGAYTAGPEVAQPSPVTADDLTNIGITLQAGTQDAVAQLATGIVASLTEANVDTVDEAQAIVDAIDSVFANTLRSGESDAVNTTVVSKDELHTLGFSGATDNNVDAIQRVLSDQTNEADVKDYADLKVLIDAAITAHSDILTAATTDDLTGIDDADYAAMGIDGVDAGNLASINDALINSPNTFTTAASVQAVVDSYNHILDLRDGDANGGNSSITLDVDDFTDLGVTLKAAGTEQDQQVAYLQELVANNGGPSVASVADIQKLADATSDLIDLVKGNSPDSDSTYGLTIDQWALLGITTDADEVGTLNARLALTADNLSEVADLTTALADRVQEARTSMAKIQAYAESDATADFDASGSFNSADVPSVQDYNFIGVTGYSYTETTSAGGWSVGTVQGDGSIRTNNLSGQRPEFDLVYIDDDQDGTVDRDFEVGGTQSADHIKIISETASAVEFYTYSQISFSGTGPTSPYYAWQYYKFERDTNGTITRISPTNTSAGTWGISKTLDTLGVDEVDHGSNPTGMTEVVRFNYDVASISYSLPITVEHRVVIDGNNLAATNELLAATGVGADAGDDPATKRSEVQYVIDQNVGRLQALAKIANYADNNGADLATYPAPDAADFAAAGVSGVADDNNIPELLVKLKSLGSSSNYAATNTAAKLQAFVKTVAIEKIASWADSDGGNGAAPILQDYLNAGLVGPFASPATTGDAITAALVPVLNELFADAAVATDAADTASQQQGIINGAQAQIEAIAKIANYADADGAIDFSDPADGVNDHLTVADFEAAGISGVADGTNQSVGTGTSVAANGYDNLNAVLAKLADSGIAFINADTVDDVQQLVTDVAVEKINAYADADGVLPLETKTISVYVDAKTGGSGNAFYLDNVEAPALELKAGTYTFDQSDTTNSGHPLSFYANADRSGSLPAGITVTQTGTPGTAGAHTVVVVDETYGGTVYYACSTHDSMGNSAEVDLPYFTPELQDYLNAGLVEDSTANPTVSINANQVPFVNALFARSDVGGTLINSDTYHSDTQPNQQSVIDDLGASMLALEKFVDYMLGENGVVKDDFSAQDFADAGLARVGSTNYSAILDRLPNYEASVRSDLDSVGKIQGFVSRAIIAEYNANQANQAPTGDDYVAAGISGADGDNYAAMNYQVAQIATGSYTDTIAALEGLVSAADATIARLSNFDLDHVAPISNDAQVVLGRSHDGSAFVPYVLGLADFGDYQDPSSDPIDKIKVTSLPSASAGTLYLQTATATAVETNVGATTPSPVAEVQTLTGITPVANAIYALTVGSDTVSVTAGDTNPSVADLAALLDTALDTLGIGVTESSGDIVLTWDSAGSVTGLVTVVERSPVQSNDEIAVTDIQSGRLTYLPASTTAAASFDFKVIDNQANASDSEYTLAIDRGDFSAATGIANTGLVQSDTNVYSQPLYIGDALTGYDGMSSLRVVISAQGGNVKLGNLNGATEITTGFDRALVGGDEICIEGTQAQINAALKTLRTNITTGQDKVDISIDVQPGGLVYNPENGHFYEYVASSSITWDNAKAAAEGRTFEGMTGYLATPTSANENAFIASKVSAQAWIGASDVQSEGVWKWMTGPEAGTQFWQGASNGSAVNGEYENWASGEPNDSGGEDHAHYLSSGMWNDFRFNNSSIQGYMVEYGGLDGDVPTVKSGVRTLTVYATEALGNVSMTLSDFEKAGVTGVDSDNVAAINRVLSLKSASDVDTNPKLQMLVNDTIAAIAKVEDYNNAANGVTTLDENDYLSAGIVGVNAANVAAINNKVSALNVDGADTHAEIQAVVSQDVIEAYADAVDAAAVTASSLATPTVADYHALELYGVDASNVDAINAFVLAATTDLANDANEIALLVQEALEMQPYLAAVAKISAYADANGVGVPVPTLEDYVDAQITGVNEYNLGMANALFANSTVGTGDATPSGTQAEQQSVIAGAQAQLDSYAKIVSYAENDSAVLPVPTDTDYTNIGLVEFPSAYVSKLNAELYTNPVGRDEVDELSELKTIASRIKVTEYANANGFEADGITALTGEFKPSIDDYANVGVTEMFDGSSMVAIDANNLDQVNDLMAMRYVGNPDADGDSTTAAGGDTDERIDVVNNATDAASNETNLDYAGTVDTIAQIQDAVSLAMGDKADADNGTFGDRAVALNKIAAFAQAVSALADQAAYDAFIANVANAAKIPSASDYNTAGVLDLTDSTESISPALATAINAKLFTGGATSAVNTVTELQPFVDSANSIVDKIGAWAEPDWSGLGTAESYVSLIPKFTNADFEQGSGSNIPGWVVYNDWVDLGVTELAGFVSPQDPVPGPTHPQGGLAQEVAVDWTGGITNRDISVTLSENYDSVHGSVVVLDTGALGGTAGDRWGTGTANNIFHGPAIWSEGTVKLKAGATVAIDFQAIDAGDAADVFGYLQEVNTGAVIDLLDFNPYVDGQNANWQTGSATLTSGQDGEYRFVFVGGSNNGDNGTQGGGKFIIDNILVNSPPEKFNGVVNSNGADDWENAQSVFDGKSTVDDSTALAFTSNAAATAGAPVSLGWYDQGDFGFDAAIADKLVIHPKNAVGNFDDLPADFDVFGWDNNSGTWELIKSFDLADTTGIVSTDGKALEYDLSDGVPNAYTGFKIEVRKTFGGGVVEITEMDFQARKVSIADLPTGSEPTFGDYNAIGFTEVNASNVADINALVFAKKSADDVSTLPQIKSVISTYLDAMGRIETFANTDGAADTNSDFTADGGETGVPTVADYQAIGMRFVVNSDGLNVPISSDNIAAINEVIAGASYGDESGDTAITTAAELRAVLNGATNAARLDAIANISGLADNTAVSVIISDNSTTATLADTETVIFELITALGTETVSGTFTAEAQWAAVAADMTGDLSTTSGYSITVSGSGLKIERADGQAFTVKPLASATIGGSSITSSDYSFTDNASTPNTLSNSGSTASGMSSVSGSGAQVTLADFAAAGVSGVTASNIEATLQKLIAVGSVSDIDTALELTAVAFPPTQTVTIDGISRETGGELSRETLSVVESTEPGASATYNWYLYSIDDASISVGDVFEIVVNGVTVTTAPIASADRAGIVQALNDVMPQANGSPVATAVDYSGKVRISIDDTYNSGDTAPAVSRFVAPSDFITSDDDGLTISATLSAQLEAGQTLQYSKDDGVSWTDITSSVSGTAVSYVDDSLTASATIQLKVTNVSAAGPVSQQAIVIDTALPVASVSSTASTASTIQSSEPGTAYLVSDTITVSTLADITGAADNLWNSVAVTAEDSDTVLSFTGLNPGTYKLYTVDAAGNLSAAATTDVTVTVPPVQIAMFQAQGDQTYYVGDEVQIIAIPTGLLVDDPDVGLEITLNNGATVEMSTSTRTSPGGQTYTLLAGRYTVTEDTGENSDYVFQDLQVTAVSAVSGKPLPYSSIGDMDINVNLSSVNLPQNIDLSNYVPPRFETLVFEEDTGLFADDLVTSQEYQFDGTNGAMSGTFSPELANNAEFFATIRGTGQTIVDSDNSTRNELVTFTDASALGTFETQAELGQYLSYSNRLTFSPKDGATLAAGTYTVSISFDGNTYTGSVTTNAVTTGDDDLRTVLYNLLNSFAAGASTNPYENGFKRFGTFDGQEVRRFDGQDFTVTFSDADFAGSFEVVEDVFDAQGYTQTRTTITENVAITADNGSSEVSNGYLSTSIERGILATIDQTGSSVSPTSDEIQRITLIAEPDHASVHAVIRLGTESIEIAYGTDNWDNVITSINLDLAAVFTDVNVRPVAALVSGSNTVLTAGSSVDVTFTWTDQTPGYIIAKQDLEAVEVFSSGFNYTLDKTAASTPVLADSDGTDDGVLTVDAGTDISSNLSGLTAGEYLYLVVDSANFWTTLSGSTDAAALTALRDLNGEHWSRAKVNANGDVDIDTSGLSNGTYKLVAMDLAGNFSEIASKTVVIQNSSAGAGDDATMSGINADTDADMELVFPNSGSAAAQGATGDSTAKVVFDLVDVAVGDTLELYADGILVYSNVITATQVAAGTLETREIDFATEADDQAGNAVVAGDDTVALELKLKHGDVYVQDNGEVTWEYTW